MNERPDEPRILLAILPPTQGQRRLALAIVLALLVAFLVMLPFARMELPAVHSFVPTIQMALLINDLFTSALLFAQFSVARQRAILVLATGYLFTALIIIPHALTFPGAFSATGLLGAGSQTSAWLYIFWHAGLPVAVIIYASLRDADHCTSMAHDSSRRTIVFSSGGDRVGVRAHLARHRRRRPPAEDASGRDPRHAVGTIPHRFAGVAGAGCARLVVASPALGARPPSRLSSPLRASVSVTTCPASSRSSPPASF